MSERAIPHVCRQIWALLSNFRVATSPVDAICFYPIEDSHDR